MFGHVFEDIKVTRIKQPSSSELLICFEGPEYTRGRVRFAGVEWSEPFSGECEALEEERLYWLHTNHGGIFEWSNMPEVVKDWEAMPVSEDGFRPIHNLGIVVVATNMQLKVFCTENLKLTLTSE